MLDILQCSEYGFVCYYCVNYTRIHDFIWFVCFCVWTEEGNVATLCSFCFLRNIHEYSELCQTCKMERFVKIVTGF